MQLSHSLLNGLCICGEFRRSVCGLLNELLDVHSKDCQRLTRAVMKFAGDVAALLILGAQQVPGQVAQLVRLHDDLGVALFEFFCSGAYLCFEALCKLAGVFLSRLSIGDVHSGGMEKNYLTVTVDNRKKREIHQTFSSIGERIVQRLAVRYALCNQCGCGFDFSLRLGEGSPPLCFPKGSSQNLFRGIAARRQTEFVRVNQYAVLCHDSGELGCLFEDGAEFRGGCDCLSSDLAFPFFRPLAVSNVAHDRELDYGAIRVAEWGGAGVHMPPATVVSDDFESQGPALAGTDAFGENSKNLAVLRRNQVVNAGAGNLLQTLCSDHAQA